MPWVGAEEMAISPEHPIFQEGMIKLKIIKITMLSTLDKKMFHGTDSSFSTTID